MNCYQQDGASKLLYFRIPRGPSCQSTQRTRLVVEEGEGQSKEAGLVTHTSTVVRPGISLGTLCTAETGVGGMRGGTGVVGAGMDLLHHEGMHSHHPGGVGTGSVGGLSSPTVTGTLPMMTISKFSPVCVVLIIFNHKIPYSDCKY